MFPTYGPIVVPISKNSLLLFWLDLSIGRQWLVQKVRTVTTYWHHNCLLGCVHSIAQSSLLPLSSVRVLDGKKVFFPGRLFPLFVVQNPRVFSRFFPLFASQLLVLPIVLPSDGCLENAISTWIAHYYCAKPMLVNSELFTPIHQGCSALVMWAAHSLNYSDSPCRHQQPWNRWYWCFFRLGRDKNAVSKGIFPPRWKKPVQGGFFFFWFLPWFFPPLGKNLRTLLLRVTADKWQERHVDLFDMSS